MIRTTISKIRKVCTIALVPRALRGNLRYTSSICAAFGKFEKFTSAVKCVQKSTKATTDDDLPQSPDKHLKDRISVVSLSKPVDLTDNNDVDIRHTEHNVIGPDIPSNISSRASLPLCKSNSATQYDKCSKVIYEIFGEPTPQEDLLVLSHVNMDTNHGKIITDKNTQLCIFGKSDSKPFKTTPRVKIKRITYDNHSGKTEDNEDNFQSVLRYDAVLMKEKEDKQVKEAKSKSAEDKQYDQQLNTSLYDVDPDEYISKWKIDTKALKLGYNEKFDEQEIDAYWTDIYETAIENKAAYYEPNQAIDLETINVYRSLKQGDTDSKDTSSGTRLIKHTPEELNTIIHGSPFDDDLCVATVKSTTAKQNEETLAQKLEHIDETPLVVAEQPKVEGFNTTPKILGNLDKPAPIANNKIDSLAHRCLKLSQSDVDKILLKEMQENLGNPITSQKASRETKTDNSLQSDTLYTSGTCEVNKPLDDFSVGKFNLSNIIPNNLTGLGGMKLNPSTLQAEKQYWHDLNRTKTSQESSEVVQSNLCAKKSENTTPSADYVKPSNIKDNATTLQAEKQYWHDLNRTKTSKESSEVVQSNLCAKKSENTTPSADYVKPSNIKDNATTLQAEKQYWHDLNRTKTSKESSEVVQSNLCAKKSENTTPSADYVKPSNIKENANATAISNDDIQTDTSALQIDEQEIRQASKPTADKHNPNLSVDIWANDNLDPKHITLQAEKQYWHDLNRTKTSKESSEVVESNLCAKKSENTTPSADYVKPSNIKDNTNATTISDDHIRTDTSALQTDELEIRQASKPTADKHNPNLSVDIWPNDQLDPKHILTCNETCSISPRFLVNVNELNSIEGAEAVLERSVLGKSLIMKEEKKDVKAQSVTEKSGESFSPGEINRCECNNAKANEANSLDDYIKMIQAENSKMTDDGPRIKKDPTMELTKRPTTEVFNATTMPPRLARNEFNPQNPLVVPTNYIKQIGTMTSTTIKPLESISKEETKQSQNPINPSKFHIDTEPYTAYEHLRNYPSYKTKENSGAYLVENILATSEKLQATSQKLQATSEKLEVASEQLHATKEQLQATSEKLEVTSEQLQSTSEKLEVSCKKNDHRDGMHTNATEIPVKGTEVSSSVGHPLADVPVNPSIDASVDPVVKSPIKALTGSPIPIVATSSNAIDGALNQTTTKADSPKANQLADKVAATLPVTGQTPLPLTSLPEIKDNIKLSELMKLVKERNRRRSSEQFLQMVKAEVKKSVPPMQQPRHRSPVFKLPGYPKLKPKPKTCNPTRRKPKKTNCSQCDLETLGLDYNLGPQFSRNETPNNDNIYQETSQGVALTNDALPSINLSEEIILQLQNMGYILESAYKRGKIGLEAAVLAKTRFQFRSKNYIPWTPIPSWPFPKKYKRPKLQCPSEGCPAPPPRSVHDPPCGLKPCSGFPTYPKRTFSLLDYCTIRLGDPKVVDIGEF